VAARIVSGGCQWNAMRDQALDRERIYDQSWHPRFACKVTWGSLSRDFMQGDQQWVFYGVIKSISLSESRMHFNLAQVWTREQYYRL
jgi:hypothetical protein